MQVATPDTLRDTPLNGAPHGSQPFGNLTLAVSPKPKEIGLSAPSVFLKQAGVCATSVDLREKQIVFSQGEPAEAVFYIQRGKVRLSVISSSGQEATIALLGAGDFLGEECVAVPTSLRTTTATAVTPATVFRIGRSEIVRALHEQNALSDIFVAYLLSRSARTQADLVDQLFSSSEERLARTLLLLARCGKHGVIPKISQEILATMVGTTRARVSLFMNRFRKLGYIDYNGGPNGVLRVHGSLANVVPHD